MILEGLRRAGVLGMNARNGDYIARWNPRALYPRVDDKLLARSLAEAAGVRVPRLIGQIGAHGDLRRLAELLAGEDEFVVKPVKGAMGKGVLVVTGREAERFVAIDGSRPTLADLAYHVSGILAGMHSLGGHDDRAMFEERLHVHAAFAALSAGGVPDLRVIVFRGVPVLAMTRLPTTESRGRANLHQGAVAAGIDLTTGLTTGGLHRGHAVSTHPDTGAGLVGLSVPHWQEMLEISARCADAFELGYLGIDLVLDARHGPVLLEANARPGLAIQLANGCGLRPRLEAVERMSLAGRSPAERARLGQSLA